MAQANLNPEHDGRFWTANKPTCEQDLQDAIQNCVGLMGQAESLQHALEAELNTQRALVHAEEDNTRFYKDRLEDANSWYRQPGFVGPTSALLTILLVSLLRK